MLQQPKYVRIQDTRSSFSWEYSVSVSEMTSAIDTITAIQLAIIEAKGAPQRVQQAKLNGCLNALFSIR